MGSVIIGKGPQGNVGLELNTLLRTHLLIWASTGGGKSWLIRRLAEQLFGKVPVIIIDREGEFPSLREHYGYVLVGPGGETPADVRSAKLLAETLLRVRASAVCDLFELKHETRAQWVKVFLDSLVDAPKSLWGPTVIVIDEAHLFCPEKGQGESEAYGAVCDLLSVGRKRGYGIILATQRLSKLSKNATAEMYNQAAGPTAQQADRERAAYEMGIAKRKGEVEEFSESLRRLEAGNFYFQGRAISMDRLLVRVGDVRTTHAEAGSGKHSAGPPPPPEKVKALLPKLADLPKQAEEKAKTEAQLRSEIRSLHAQLRSRPAETKTVQVADPKAIRTAVQKAEAPLLANLQDIQRQFQIVLVKIKRAGDFITEIVKTEVPKPKMVQMPTPPRPTNQTKETDYTHPKNFVNDAHVFKTTMPRSAVVITHGSGALPKGERVVLTAIAQYQDGVQRDQVTILTGFKRSTRDAYILRLANRGYVTANGDGIQATEEGIAALGSGYEPLPTGDALLQHWLGRLPEGERRVLEIVVEAYPHAIQRDTLDERTGFKRSTRDAYLLRLGARRLVTSVGRSQVKASEELFD